LWSFVSTLKMNPSAVRNPQLGARRGASAALAAELQQAIACYKAESEMLMGIRQLQGGSG